MSSKSKFTPPKFLVIGGKKVRVVVKDVLRADDGEEAFGLFSDGLIELSRETPADEQVATLLHECIHAALAISGVGEILDGKVEEAVCRAVELIAPNIYFKSKK